MTEIPEDVQADIKDLDSPKNRELEDQQNYEESKHLIKENEELGEQIGILTTFKDQLEKMAEYFNKEKRTEFLADILENLRIIIAEKVGSLEGWFTGECEF